MLAMDFLDSLLESDVIILFDELLNERLGFKIKSRRCAARMRQSVSRAGFTFPADEALDGREANAEEVGNFRLRMIVVFISVNDPGA